MNNSWQLQEAKARFSQLVEQALKGQVQIVTKHGKEAVVLISMDHYHQLNKPAENLVSFFNKSPLKGMQLEIERDQSPLRSIDI